MLTQVHPGVNPISIPPLDHRRILLDQLRQQPVTSSGKATVIGSAPSAATATLSE
jgi:hypothetical protein